MAIFSDKLKRGLCVETKAWRVAYGNACNEKYGKIMQQDRNAIADIKKRLQRPIKDLDDIRFLMAALDELRETEIRIDMMIPTIEVILHSSLKIKCTVTNYLFLIGCFHSIGDVTKFNAVVSVWQ